MMNDVCIKHFSCFKKITIKTFFEKTRPIFRTTSNITSNKKAK